MKNHVDLVTVWALSIMTYITQNNIIFVLTVIGHIFWIIKTMPVAFKNIKDFKNWIYARMVKKTDKV